MPLSRDETRSPDAERYPCPAMATPSNPALSQLRLREAGVLVITPATAMAIVLKVTGGRELALLAATLTAALALLIGVLAVSQPMLCALVHHLPEIIRTRSEGRSMGRVVKAAVCGPRKTAADAESKRIAARAYASDRRWDNPTTVGDMMRISRSTPTSLTKKGSGQPPSRAKVRPAVR